MLGGVEVSGFGEEAFWPNTFPIWHAGKYARISNQMAGNGFLVP